MYSKSNTATFDEYMTIEYKCCTLIYVMCTVRTTNVKGLHANYKYTIVSCIGI